MKILKISGFIMGILLVGFLSLLIYQGHVSREMPDISTFNAEKMTLAVCGDKPNCVSSFQNSDDTHYIAPTNITFDKLIKIEEYFSDCKSIKKSENYWYYTCKTSLMGFVDDTEILYLADQKKLHYRSASRVGHSDLGANRKRIEKFISSLK